MEISTVLFTPKLLVFTVSSTGRSADRMKQILESQAELARKAVDKLNEQCTITGVLYQYIVVPDSIGVAFS